MKSITIIALSLAIATPAFAGGPGHNNDKRPAVDLSADVNTSKHGPLASVDANVKGVAKADVDVLSSNRKGASVLDLDVNLGKAKGKGGNSGHYDFGGGVGY